MPFSESLTFVYFILFLFFNVTILSDQLSEHLLTFMTCCIVFVIFMSNFICDILLIKQFCCKKNKPLSD